MPFDPKMKGTFRCRVGLDDVDPHQRDCSR
jgi:hypothetical protein